MSSSGQVSCPTCHVEVAPGSAFCTRCGAALPGLTVITPVTDDAQQWGGSRRRERRRDVAAHPASVPVPADGSLLTQVAFVAPHDVALGPAFDGVTPASAGRRLAAYTLDLLAVAIPAAAVLLLTGEVVLGALVGLELAAALVVWEARSGRTPAGVLLGLRTAQVETPYAPGLARAAGRASVLAASHLLVVGPWALVGTAALDGGRRQAWHDKAARTVVVDVRALERAGAGSAPEGAPVVAPVVHAVPAPTRAAAPTAPAVAQPESLAPALQAQVPARVQPQASVRVQALVPVQPPAPPAPIAAEAVAPAGFEAASAEPVPADQGAAVARPSSPAPAPVHAPTSYAVTLDTGEAMAVSGPGYVGRRPAPPAGERCDHVIAIDDPGRSLSRTHARFGIDAAGFWVEDCGSANGTAVVGADGSGVQAVPGERHHVPQGGSVRLGDRTFTVRPLP